MLVGAAGCGPPQLPPAPSASPAAKGRSDEASVATSPQHETWDAVFIRGAKVGYARTVTIPVEQEGIPLVRIETVHVLSVQRAGQPTEQRIVSTSIETPDGKLLRFVGEVHAGSTPMRVTGVVNDGRLTLTTDAGGKPEVTTIPWPADAGGFHAVEQSLARRPMQPGERRRLVALMPGINQLVEIELAAVGFEPTPLVGHREDLLRIESTATLPDGQTLASRLWMSRDGQVRKTRFEPLEQEIIRTTREVALAELDSAVDLVLDTTVPVNRTLDDPHRTRRIRYRLRLADGDPARLIDHNPRQRVRALDARTAEIEVFAAGLDQRGDEARPPAPDSVAPPSLVERPATDDDRRPNSMVQSDDPLIVLMAAEAVGDATDPREVAARLEAYVHRVIERKDFSHAFATAAEVARARQGDCTEHAVLLAALARARRLPARVAIGLVYSPSGPGFMYHMWNEVWLGDRWTPLDATIGQGGLGAAHLKLADSNLRGASAYSCFLPVAQVMGRLTLEILEVE
jgi:transglutaminase-like putative cysteine protease